MVILLDVVQDDLHCYTSPNGLTNVSGNVEIVFQLLSHIYHLLAEIELAIR
jgi:hypothetical protein